MGIVNYLRVQWERTGGVLAGLAGGAALVGSWMGVSTSHSTKEQLAYIASGGFASLFLALLGATLWLSADLRDEWRKLDQLNEALAGPADREVILEVPAPADSGDGPRDRAAVPSELRRSTAHG